MHLQDIPYKQQWLVLFTIALAGCGLHAAPSYLQNGEWHFGIGVGWGETHRLSLNSTPAFRHFDGGLEAVSGNIPDSVGGHEEVSDRFYDDGFVGLSHVDGSAVTTEENPLTTFWGYESADQLSDGHVVFTAEGSMSTRLGEESHHSRALHRRGEQETELFPVIELSRIWRSESGRHDLGVTLGISWFNASDSMPMQDTLAYSRELVHSRVEVQDRYDLGGVVPPVPPYDGPATPPGPVIDNLPTERVVSETPVSVEQREFLGRSGVDASLKNQRVTLGGTWSLYGQGAAGRRNNNPRETGFAIRLVSLSLDAGLVLNRVDLALEERSEIFELSGDTRAVGGYYEERRSREQDVHTSFGSYASLGANFALNREQNRFLSLRLRRTEARSVSVLSTTGRAHLELGGWSMITNFDFKF